MARHALARIDPAFDGSEGDIFIGYIFDPNIESKKVANHWAWQAFRLRLDDSGSSGVSCRRRVRLLSTGLHLRRRGGAGRPSCSMFWLKWVCRTQRLA